MISPGLKFFICSIVGGLADRVPTDANAHNSDRGSTDTWSGWTTSTSVSFSTLSYLISNFPFGFFSTTTPARALPSFPLWSNRDPTSRALISAAEKFFNLDLGLLRPLFFLGIGYILVN